jgi:hypothetical protein
VSVSAAIPSTSSTRNYAIVTAAYWGFTLTDGALRMLVLLHFFRLGLLALHPRLPLPALRGRGDRREPGRRLARDPLRHRADAGGRAGDADRRLPHALGRLAGLGGGALGAWVVAAQGVCGVAKDLTKTASKSAIKLTAGDASGRLFRLVAFFTGSKNAMKGVGFFAGGLLLEMLGFRGALLGMAAALALILAGVVLSLPAADGEGEGVAIGAGALREEPRREPARRRTRLPVRRAGRVVRGRAAGVPLRLRLDLHDGGRLPRPLDHRLRRRPGRGARAGAPERGRAQHGGAAARLWSLLLALVPATLAAALLSTPRGRTSSSSSASRSSASRSR